MWSVSLKTRGTVGRVGYKALELCGGRDRVVLAVAVHRAVSSIGASLAQAASNCLPSCAAIFRSRICPGSAGVASLTWVNCSVRPSRAIRSSTRRVAPTSASRWLLQRQRAALAQPPRAIFDDARGQLRHPRRRRARPRRERKHVQMRQPAFVDEIERTGEHRPRSRSESRRSDRRRTPCRAAAAAPASQNAIASARECRRFMRLRMRSSPDCSDRCRCGISRASLANASSRSRSASTESIDDSRSRFSSGTCLRICLTSVPSFGAPGRSAP